MLLKAGQGHLQMRHMTAREYARLQGVPDTYPINVGELEAITRFGDGVCVPLIAWIARNILSQLID
jgi:DNA (cytosine-5)-methyltransferase 1